MPNVFACTDVDRQPVVYAGRFVDQTAGADLPDDCVVLGEQDAFPHKLAEILDRANTLVLLDLPSFPLESITDMHWDVPIVVVLPAGFDAKSLITPFGPRLFERLGHFDRIITTDSGLWQELRRRYSWAESQRVPVAGNHLSEALKTICTLLRAKPTFPTTLEASDIERDRYFNKALHRVQAAALESRFAATQMERDNRVTLDVLNVGAGVGLWASSFDLTKTRFVGLDAREDLVEAARANFPEGRFDHLGPNLLFPYEDESFDLVFSVTVMHHNSAPAKRTLLSEMWRVARPGGRLLFLEYFVFTRRSEEPITYPMSITDFEDLILDATAGQVALEYVESLRYPDEDLRRGGLISLRRLGVPGP
jgi:SAM-dependent methyltransferase